MLTAALNQLWCLILAYMVETPFVTAILHPDNLCARLTSSVPVHITAIHDVLRPKTQLTL